MPATSQQHNIVYRVLGAAQAAMENTRVARSLQMMTRMSSQLKAGLLGMRGLMIGFAGSLVAVGLGLRRTVTAYAEYTQAQSRMRTVLALAGNQARIHAQLAGSLAERVGIDLGYSLVEANDAMTRLLETGLGTHASMRVFESGMRLARISEMDTETSTQFLIDSFQMFRNEMNTNHYELQEFTDLLSGRLAVAAAMSSTSIEQLQQSFRYAGTEMSALGYDSREVMSALAGLSTVGIRGTTAGTRMRQMIAQLADPSQRVRRRIDELAGSTGAWQQIVFDATGARRGLPDMMNQVFQLFARLPTEAERAELAFALFGTRAFAAGISMATFNEAANKTLEVYDELENDSAVRARLMEAERQRMMSFGMQFEQLKQGATDLAIAFGEILFGAMDETGEGFGTTVREIARAIRLLGQEGGETTGEFQSMSPRIREIATNIRELFINIAKLLKVLWAAGAWILNFTQQHPYLVASIVGIRLAFGGFLNVLRFLPTALRATGIALRFVGGQASASTRNVALLRGAMMLLGVELAGRATRALQDYYIQHWGMQREMDELRESTIAEYSELARSIPIVGQLVSQYIDLAGAMQKVFQVHAQLSEQRAAEAARTVEKTGSERIGEYAGRIREERLAQGRTETEVQMEAASRVTANSVNQLAASLEAYGIQSEETIRGTLTRQGMRSGVLSEIMPRILSYQRGITREQAEQEARASAPQTWLGTPNVARSIELNVRQLNELDRATQTITEAFHGLAAAVPESPEFKQSIPTAQDAYVRRSGLMSVSGGDIVVSRRHLADAIFASRGAMAGPAVGMSAERTIAGPAPSAPTGGDVYVTVPVTIDGREIARAVGRAEIRQLERGGARLQPGQRRSLRETGFNRAV